MNNLQCKLRKLDKQHSKYTIYKFNMIKMDTIITVVRLDRMEFWFDVYGNEYKEVDVKQILMSTKYNPVMDSKK